ncbi:MAG TPA: hypothetical protein VK204_13755, partial [Nocardioidaceae bacterium]|nr:hypothetical protein [Nocardioidaceae bacterium]
DAATPASGAPTRSGGGTPDPEPHGEPQPKPSPEPAPEPGNHPNAAGSSSTTDPAPPADDPALEPEPKPGPEPKDEPNPASEAESASEDREDPRHHPGAGSDDPGPAGSSPHDPGPAAADPTPPADDPGPPADDPGDWWSGDPWAGTPRPANPWGGPPLTPPPDKAAPAEAAPPDAAPPDAAPPPETAPPADPVPPDTQRPGADPDGGQDPPQPGPTDAFLTPFRAQDLPPCPCRGGSYLLDWAKLMPTVTLYLHLHADSIAAGHGVARWEGLGPVTLQYIQEFLGPHCRFAVKPVIDPATLAPVDAYEIPERHREALHLRTPADVFPYAPNTGRGKQADHTNAYRPIPAGGPPGQTGLHNLGPMTGYHHRVKTHAGWRLEQPFPGIYLWMSPHGSIFLVDHTGTRQLHGPQTTTTPDRPQTPAQPTPRPHNDQRSPLEDQLATLVGKAA